MRRCGGIGRRKGLKIPRWQHRTGSSPVSGTKIPVLVRGRDFYLLAVTSSLLLKISLVWNFRKVKVKLYSKIQKSHKARLKKSHR